MIRRPPRSPLFPSATLFRSDNRRPGGTQFGQHAGAKPAQTAGDEDDALVECVGHVPLLRSDSTEGLEDRKSTRLNSSHANISYAVFCLKKKKSNLLY